VIGDRTLSLEPLAGRRFDTVIDCAGYDPAVVSLSVSALRDSVDRYVFVSSVSVYADQSIPAVEGQLSSPTTPTADARPPANRSSCPSSGRARSSPAPA
jgi:hypothetical protein